MYTYIYNMIRLDMGGNFYMTGEMKGNIQTSNGNPVKFTSINLIL